MAAVNSNALDVLLLTDRRCGAKSRSPRGRVVRRHLGEVVGGLAQLVRAGVSYAPGPGFESLIRHSLGCKSVSCLDVARSAG